MLLSKTGRLSSETDCTQYGKGKPKGYGWVQNPGAKGDGGKGGKGKWNDTGNGKNKNTKGKGNGKKG